LLNVQNFCGIKLEIVIVTKIAVYDICWHFIHTMWSRST